MKIGLYLSMVSFLSLIGDHAIADVVRIDFSDVVENSPIIEELEKDLPGDRSSVDIQLAKLIKEERGKTAALNLKIYDSHAFCSRMGCSPFWEVETVFEITYQINQNCGIDKVQAVI